MRATKILLAAALCAAPPLSAQTLDMYFIDVEGGQATLYVAPSGETMLVDTGFPGERDQNRFAEVFARAGVERIDHLLLSHYHGDHYGGLEALAERMPIGHYYDHGSSIESDRPRVVEFEARYAEISQGARTVLVPGDRIPLGDLDVLVVASNDQFIESPIAGAPGAGLANPACASWQPRDESRVDPDNHYSVGFVITYGEFRTLNLSDLTWSREPKLMCPNNLIGTVDLYHTSHHGLDQSGSEALVHAIRPRVAVMNNGPRKGGSVQALDIIHASPGLEDLWQLHWSYHGLAEHNAPGVFIANIDDPATLAGLINPEESAQAGGRGGRGGGGGGRGAGDHDPAYWVEASARSDGSFTVTNSRNGFSKTYEARAR